jgi:hypothetical protein
MRIITTSCVVLLLATADPAAAQSLLVNGDFDNDLSGWLVDASVSPMPVWSAFDIAAPERSGSVLVSNTSPDAAVRIYPLEQCIALTAAGPYRIVAHGYIPPGQAAGRLVVSYWLSSDNPDCPLWQGAQAAGGNFLTTIGGWGRYAQSIDAALPSPLPPNARIKIFLGVEKDAAGGEFFGYFDALSVVGDAIFSDGFDRP